MNARTAVAAMVLMLITGAVEAAPGVDDRACGLLTNADIQTALGDSLRGSKEIDTPNGSLLLSQCVLTTTGTTSVSLVAVERNPAARSGDTPRQYWKKQLRDAARTGRWAGHKEPASTLRGHQRRTGPTGEADGEADVRDLRRVPHLGEEAYWASNPVVGVLYVLTGERFLRISVGGVRDQSARLRTSEKLARLVLARLPRQH